MKRYFLKYARRGRRGLTGLRFPGYALPAVALCVGILTAAIVISKTPENTIKGFGDIIILSGSNTSVLSAYWKCSRYHIFAALLSTSFLGVLTIPVLLGYRGFTLCCTSAALILNYTDNGAMLSAIMLGVPSLISVPCLLLIASDSMRSSAELITARFGLHQRYPSRYSPRCIFLCLGALIPVALFENQMLPKLILYFIN